MNYNKSLEFDIIRTQLAEYALSASAKEKSLSLKPFLKETECKNRMEETTQAKKVLRGLGNPPLSSMENFDEIIALVKAGSMLIPEQLNHIERFLATCKRLASYLKRAETISAPISSYGSYIDELADLREEISLTIRGDQVDDEASTLLKNIRRKLEHGKTSIQGQLERLLRNNPNWFAESFVTTRQGRYVLAVKKQYKNSVSGTVVELSGTGATCFMEPSSIRKTQNELDELSIQEENEIIRILYTLTGVVEAYLPQLEGNKYYFEVLDFLFAKAKLSDNMKANPVQVDTKREVQIINGKHPLIDKDICVPLTISIGDSIQGIVITGPNTGGKTVSLKTVGLLSLMAQSGLHVPAEPESHFSMHNAILCDIGDGQSISENLSTFSAHMKNIISILEQTSNESLILLDELGSGTDPAEGMGLAVAIIRELLDKNCLFITTTHYPEVKEYATKTQGLVNARMAFDKEHLTPLYQLEIGEAGESCALYIAQKLGLPTHMLETAHHATYGEAVQYKVLTTEQQPQKSIPKIQKEVLKEIPATPVVSFQLGDSVMVSPENKVGIVYQTADNKGTVGVQIHKQKMLVNHKRLRLLAHAEELYPDDYDFSIVFDSVTNRKHRKQMGKKHNPDIFIEHK